MSIYDTVGPKELQIKTIASCAKHYGLGDKIPLENGLYISYGGWFTVFCGRVAILGNGDEVFDKWGHAINLNTILDPRNPVTQHAGTIEKETAPTGPPLHDIEEGKQPSREKREKYQETQSVIAACEATTSGIKALAAWIQDKHPIPTSIKQVVFELDEALSGLCTAVLFEEERYRTLEKRNP